MLPCPLWNRSLLGIQRTRPRSGMFPLDSCMLWLQLLDRMSLLDSQCILNMPYLVRIFLSGMAYTRLVFQTSMNQLRTMSSGGRPR